MPIPRFPVMSTSPATVNLLTGAVVAIPTLPEFLTMNKSPLLLSSEDNAKRSDAPPEAEISRSASGPPSLMPTFPLLSITIALRILPASKTKSLAFA